MMKIDISVTYLIIGIAINLIGNSYFEYVPESIWSELLCIVGWPFLLIYMAHTHFECRRAEEDYECGRDAVNYCDQPKELCCFQCEKVDNCEFFKCDEFDNVEYGCDCKYARKVKK